MTYGFVSGYLGVIGKTLSLALLVSGCNVNVGSTLEDKRVELEGEIDKLDELTEIPVCGDQSLKDLVTEDAVSDECRDVLESILPEQQTNSEDRLLISGTHVNAEGGLEVFVQGLDASGVAVNLDSLADLSAEVTLGGQVTSLSVELSIDVLTEFDASEPLLSLSLVSDYSASMRDEDLDDLMEIQSDLVNILPPVHQTEAIIFSDDVLVRQTFTRDQELLRSAIAWDTEFERASTALYDGV